MLGSNHAPSLAVSLQVAEGGVRPVRGCLWAAAMLQHSWSGGTDWADPYSWLREGGLENEMVTGSPQTRWLCKGLEKERGRGGSSGGC